MSASELQRLLVDLEGQETFAEEIGQLQQEPAAVASWAAGRGYQLALVEAEDLLDRVVGLSDEDLENVAGGWAGDSDPGNGSGSGGGG